MYSYNSYNYLLTWINKYIYSFILKSYTFIFKYYKKYFVVWHRLVILGYHDVSDDSYFTALQAKNF